MWNYVRALSFSKCLHLERPWEDLVRRQLKVSQEKSSHQKLNQLWWGSGHAILKYGTLAFQTTVEGHTVEGKNTLTFPSSFSEASHKTHLRSSFPVPGQRNVLIAKDTKDLNKQSLSISPQRITIRPYVLCSIILLSICPPFIKLKHKFHRFLCFHVISYLLHSSPSWGSTTFATP
jgi:hypothetical protein